MNLLVMARAWIPRRILRAVSVRAFVPTAWGVARGVEVRACVCVCVWCVVRVYAGVHARVCVCVRGGQGAGASTA